MTRWSAVSLPTTPTLLDATTTGHKNDCERVLLFFQYCWRLRVCETFKAIKSQLYTSIKENSFKIIITHNVYVHTTEKKRKIRTIIYIFNHKKFNTRFTVNNTLITKLKWTLLIYLFTNSHAIMKSQEPIHELMDDNTHPLWFKWSGYTESMIH